MASALQQRRAEKGLSQSQAAQSANINLRLYQYYEQNYRDISKAKAETIIRICLALGCKASDIITDESARSAWLDYEQAMGK